VFPVNPAALDIAAGDLGAPVFLSPGRTLAAGGRTGRRQPGGAVEDPRWTAAGSGQSIRSGLAAGV
jgi:hypothetical protein